jgi:hypothetical protein
MEVPYNSNVVPLVPIHREIVKACEPVLLLYAVPCMISRRGWRSCNCKDTLRLLVLYHMSDQLQVPEVE